MGKFFTKEVVAVVALVLLAGVFYGGYRFHLTVLRLYVVNDRLATTTAQLKLSEDQNKILAEVNANLEQNLTQAQTDIASLSSSLASEQAKNSMFEGQIRALGSTVGTLQKLSQTDKELLRKYSKVFFLSENYIPSDLMNIASSSVYGSDKILQIHAKVAPYLSRLMVATASFNAPVQIISAYRSFDDQTALKTGYKLTYGAGANKFSADQGYSEHQLGTTFDFTTPALGLGFTKFESTSAYIWLTQNAYQYGFVLSYPKKNTYYQFEPWHWRFVGVALATKMHLNNQYFYDLDQREIDSYLISIFD
jgi:D-alanyl-D-alanine carboxypeptidase